MPTGNRLQFTMGSNRKLAMLISAISVIGSVNEAREGVYTSHNNTEQED